MKKCFASILFFAMFFFISCFVTRKHYTPSKKYDQHTLQQDYLLLRKILQQKHPSLYWYTPKDSMDIYFEKYYHSIRDSMTEQQFAWHVLAPLVSTIRCGHTSVSNSKDYSRWASNKRMPSFPLYMKIWNDTMLVMANMNIKDSVIKKGTLITSVNGIPNHELIQSIFSYLPRDGNANTINDIRISANFPYYHRNIFGLSKLYHVTYIDSSGNKKAADLPLFTPQKDTALKHLAIRGEKSFPKIKRSSYYRSLHIDSSGRFGVMTINTFTKGKLRTFFRRSFKELHERNVNDLIIDVRLNGGGRVGLSTLLTKYISRSPFKVADSLFAPVKNLGPYTKYISGKWLNNIEMFFITGKRKEGKYHITHLEHKLYQPKKNNHYNGKLYVLTSGPTFSAAALFCNVVKGQPGIILAGEETGGGWYGNNGIMIPDIILPHTRLRVRLPLFRLIQYQHGNKTGTGIIPDMYIGTSYDALLKGYDKKMKEIKQMIMAQNPK